MGVIMYTIKGANSINLVYKYGIPSTLNIHLDAI